MERSAAAPPRVNSQPTANSNELTLGVGDWKLEFERFGSWKLEFERFGGWKLKVGN
jgi:hypothetical protein